MGFGNTEEIVTKVAAVRLFEAGPIDMHNLAPKILPDTVASAKILEGDGGAGTIKQLEFTEAYPYFDFIKESIDVLDKEKLELRYTRYYEGGDLGKKLHSAVYAVKLVPLPDGGCVFKRTGEFNTIPGVELTEEDVQTLKAQDIAQFRALEGYLIDNPTAYASDQGLSHNKSISAREELCD